MSTMKNQYCGSHDPAKHDLFCTHRNVGTEAATVGTTLSGSGIAPRPLLGPRRMRLMLGESLSWLSCCCWLGFILFCFMNKSSWIHLRFDFVLIWILRSRRARYFCGAFETLLCSILQNKAIISNFLFGWEFHTLRCTSGMTAWARYVRVLFTGLGTENTGLFWNVRHFARPWVPHGDSVTIWTRSTQSSSEFRSTTGWRVWHGSPSR